MSLLLTILAFLFIFSLLILIHEFGHFYAAKRSGVKVEEFGMGLPPRIWGIKKGETLYSINWIPFGGFVRTLGEDASSEESKSSKRSFANQSLRVQAFIVCAGVIMNLLLSFVLLTIGFWMGIEPLIASQEDFYKGIREGSIQVEPGVVVVESNEPYNLVTHGDLELELRSFEPGDRLLGFETLEEWDALVESIQAGEVEAPLLPIDHADGRKGGEFLSGELLDQTQFELLYVPRLAYKESKDAVFSGVLKEGDLVLAVDSSGVPQPVLTEEDLYGALEAAMESAELKEGGDSSQEIPLTFTVYRPGEGDLELNIDFPFQSPVISYVEVGSTAETAGLRVGDSVLSVGGERVRSGAQVAEFTQSKKVRVDEVPGEEVPGEEASVATEVITYLVSRPGVTLPLRLTVPLSVEDSRIGVGIADLLPYYGELSLYETQSLHSLLDIRELRYGVLAPVVAIEEMWRLGKMTALMFGNVLGQFITANGVPEGVSGPVGIAQMTGLVVQDGFAATLRFVALLSLSLGVINILPLPALDGGHFIMILFRAITGKKPNPRWEQFIHSAGFVFLLLLIAYITFNDVLKLF
jgi:regulator of sigma E protease